FNKFIESSPEFQFQIALYNVGYVEPQNSRLDVGTGEKLSILKNHLHCWNDVSPSSIHEFYLEDTYNGRGLTHGDVEPLFHDGVLAHWSTESHETFSSLTLNIVQLPSPNKGLALKEWKIVEHTLE
ncbi:hypothetical protein FRC07_014119, partial [Ceratobasidium sp. 392]